MLGTRCGKSKYDSFVPLAALSCEPQSGGILLVQFTERLWLRQPSVLWCEKCGAVAKPQNRDP